MYIHDYTQRLFYTSKESAMVPQTVKVCRNMFYFVKAAAGLIHSCVFQVYVLKRPHVDEFLKRMGELFECVLFTASLAKVRNTALLPTAAQYQ